MLVRYQDVVDLEVQKVEDVPNNSELSPSVLQTESNSRILWKKFLEIINYSNALIGAGVIVFPAAMNQGGVGASIVFTTLTAIICSFTSCLLICCSNMLHLDTYQDLATNICGTPGRIILIICQFFYPLLVIIMYGISVTDNIIHITSYYFPNIAILSSRAFILFIFLLVFFAPLSMLRDISFLDKFSLVSILLDIEIVIFVFCRLLPFSNITFLDNSAYNFGKSKFFQTMSTMCFALTSHHNVLQMYKKSKDKCPGKYYKTIFISHGIIGAVIVLITLFGYGAFNVTVAGNLFNYYCQGDNFADISRILFTLTIALTYPFQIFASREVLRGLFKDHFSNHWWLHYFSTFILLAISYFIPVFFEDIAFIMELGGSLMAAPIAYILPTIFYIKTFHKTWAPRTLEMIILWIIIIYGGFIFIFSTSFSIYDFITGREISVYKYWCPDFFH